MKIALGWMVFKIQSLVSVLSTRSRRHAALKAGSVSLYEPEIEIEAPAVSMQYKF
jgi:hypothetical protein